MNIPPHILYREYPLIKFKLKGKRMIVFIFPGYLPVKNKIGGNKSYTGISVFFIIIIIFIKFIRFIT